MTHHSSQSIQSAIALCRRRRAIEAAMRGEDAEPGAVSETQAVIFRSLSTEMRAVLEDVAEETIPMQFGRMLGELWLSLDRGRSERGN